MQEAIREVLVDAPNVNVGLMKYSGMNEYGFGSDENTRNHFVGGVVFPVSPIYENASDFIGSFDSRDNLPSPGSKNVREFIADVADEWEAEGGTPIVDALYEAALYYRGEPMHYGKNKNNTDNMDSAGSHPASYEGGTEMPSRVDTVGRSSIANANYISPIKSECQSNYIVLMSDGAPTYYYSNASTWGGSQGPFATTLKSGHASELATAIDNDGACLTGNGENVDTTVTRLTAGTCGREITQYLANNDQMPDAGRSDNDGVEGEQTVKTFTIGFGQDLEDGAEEYLRSLETVDGNGYYTADNKTQLKDAFRSIFETVSESSGSLSSPGYSVNVKSGLEHEEDIYIPVFDRRNTPTWSGNLKKFKLVDVDGERKIRGKNNQNAVNNLGSFTDDAFDYWSASTTADGKDVLSGGVAQLITPVDRLVLTDVGCTANDCNLTVSGNSHKLKNENTDITSTLLDLDDQGLSDAAKATKRTRIINYIRGWEDGFYDSNATVQGIPRRHMGDMLHSEPVVITYNKGAADGTGKKQFIFAGTNEGYLHAFDTDSGEESFAFMPSELLKNIDTMYEDNGTADDHKYGVDGSLTYWHDDADGNGNVNGSESVYLYFGLRRGGRSYYVLDISGLNATEPTVKLKWKISGEGTISANDDDEDSSENDLAGLGQSWSPPYLAKVGITSGTGSAIKEAVIISGGYDEQEDEDVGNTQTVGNINTSDAATMGNNIYILDAKTGALLWSLRKSMGDSQVTRSIPGGLRVLDTTNNGVVDRIYFADTGGSLWRLDLSETLSLTSDTESVLKKLAFLGDSSGTGSNARMFYNEPGVAILSPNGKTSFAVSIGSGFRAHPNDKTIDDKFFVIKDYYPLASLPSDFETVDIDDLASISVGDTITHTDFETKTKGWYLSLPEDGEKVLASSVTVDGVVSFTTLVPATHTEEGVDPCAAPITSGRYYAINMITGEPGFNLDNSRPTDTNPEAITDNDLYITATSGEIPGKPQVVFNGMTTEDVTDDDGTVTKVTCEHPVDIRVGKRLDQVTGYNACRLESIYWNHPEE